MKVIKSRIKEIKRGRIGGSFYPSFENKAKQPNNETTGEPSSKNIERSQE